MPLGGPCNLWGRRAVTHASKRRLEIFFFLAVLALSAFFSDHLTRIDNNRQLFFCLIL